MEDDKTYRVKFICKNCESKWIDKQDKGSELPFSAICPNCGCNTGRSIPISKDMTIYDLGY